MRRVSARGKRKCCVRLEKKNQYVKMKKNK